MTQNQPTESDVEAEEAEKWITALRLKIQKRSAVKIEQETGISETRLSRHLKEVGISAMVILHIHDRVENFHKAVSGVWEKVSAAGKWMEQTVSEFRGIAAKLKEDLSATAAGAKAEVSRLVDEARRHNEEVKNSKQNAIEDTKRAIEPLAARIHDDAEEVRAGRDDAVARLKRAAEPVISEMSRERDLVKRTSDVMVDRISNQGEKAVAKLQEAWRAELDAAKESVSGAVREEMSRVEAELARLEALRSRAEEANDAFRKGLEQTLGEAKQHADRAIAAASERLAPLESRHSSLAREMERVSDIQKSMLSSSRDTLDRLKSTLAEMDKARADLSKAKDELEARDQTVAMQREAIDALSGSVAKMCEFTCALVATDTEKKQWQQIYELQVRAAEFQKKGEPWNAIQCHWAIMRVGTKPPKLGNPGWAIASVGGD